jgi:Mlc titration factor MtfA (ptsG expression regulator)
MIHKLVPLAVVITVVTSVFRRIKYTNAYRWVPFYHLTISRIGITQRQQALLMMRFPFYNHLSAKDKLFFEKRLIKFMKLHRFVGRGIEVTEEMKLVISGCAAMITYGLPGIYLTDFPTILIYPDKYYSTINKTYHHGEVNPKAGFIVLSWKAVEEGLDDHTDGRNLAIHEMTHAIHLADMIDSREAYFLDANYFTDFKRIAVVMMPRLAEDPDPFLRKYGSTNIFEFFAVCVEHFYEKPNELKLHHPELYRVLCGVLGFDILELQRPQR